MQWIPAAMLMLVANAVLAQSATSIDDNKSASPARIGLVMEVESGPGPNDLESLPVVFDRGLECVLDGIAARMA